MKFDLHGRMTLDEAGDDLCEQTLVGHDARNAQAARHGVLELRKVSDWSHAANIGWANRLLGRAEPERRALERIGESDADTLAKLEAEARIAVLLADTARAERIDSILAEQSARPMLPLLIRGATIVARAHIATGLGRRDQAVALLQDACARGVILLGSSHAFHEDLLLAPLRGYPPFEALLKPDG